MGNRGKTHTSTKKATVSSNKTNKTTNQLLGIAILALAIFATATFFTNAMGLLGAFMKQAMLVTTGNGRYILPLLLLLIGIHMLTKGKLTFNARTIGLTLLYLMLLFYLHHSIPTEQNFQAGLEGQGGGIIGALGSSLLILLFGKIGSYIVMLTLAFISLVLITGATLSQLGMLTALRAKTVSNRIGRSIMNFLFEEVEPDIEAGEEDTKKKKKATRAAKQIETLQPYDYAEDENTQPVIHNHIEGPNSVFSMTNNPAFQPLKSATNPKQNNNQPPSTVQEDAAPENKEIKLEPLALIDGKEYSLPPVTLLADLGNSSHGPSQKELTARTHILEETLQNFGIGAKVTEVSVGPTITRYEIQPPAGIKVSRIVGLADDLALSLAAPGVRIEAPIPGKAAVGIEVPNQEVSSVGLRELLESRAFTTPVAKLTVALGKDIAGKPITADLSKMPHLLVAGATGAGKSVCINTLVASILFRATPDEVKFLMIDPKMVELTTYNGIPHLISPVVTDAKKSAGTLRWAVKEMERRYGLFAQSGVRDISRYNKLCDSAEGNEHAPLPFIVIIIDELADLMMVAPADVEDSICRLAQMARAAGMHLVIATQRPSVDVITGLIKANIPSRISFAVSSQMDSRTILDMGGAEKLLGKGDMLFFPVGSPKPVRVQGAFLSDQEVESLVEFIKEQASPVYDEQVLKTPIKEEKKSPSSEMDDELLPQAVQIFIESGTASISLLQRRLHIGYARAARLVDIMERNGIVGGFEGSKPRAILMSLEQFQQTFQQESQS